MSHSEWSQHVHFYYRTIRYHTEVMLGLEDAFARRGGRGQLDSIKVPELVEAARLLLTTGTMVHLIVSYA